MHKHIVKQGETLSSIAAQYKITDWEAIYNHEANTRFKEFRPNPDSIYPGDILYIPDTEPTNYQFSTNQKHAVQVEIPKQKIILQLKESIDKDLESVKYEIRIGEKIIEGETSNGKIEEEIPVSQSKAILRIWPDPSSDVPQEFSLALGHLDPEDEISGLQARLQNLGYYDKSIDDDFGFHSSDAIIDFQLDHDLEPTGKFDEETKDKLTGYFE